MKKFSDIMRSESKKTDEIYSLIADKIKVSEYVESKIGENDLFEHRIYAGYDPTDARKSIAPPCVIKMNNAWRRMIFVNDIYNRDYIFNQLLTWRSDIGESWEPYYKNIKPGFVVEKIVENPHTLIKFFVFAGKVKYIWMQTWSIRSGNIEQVASTMYDENYMKISAKWNDIANPDYKKPARLKEMVDLSEKISGSLKFARVDLYYNDDKILFSEMTHQISAGTTGFPEWFDIEMGCAWEGNCE